MKEAENKESMQTVEHPMVGTSVNTSDRATGISTGVSKHLPKKGKKVTAHPIQLAYFESKGWVTTKEK